MAQSKRHILCLSLGKKLCNAFLKFFYSGVKARIYNTRVCPEMSTGTETYRGILFFSAVPDGISDCDCRRAYLTVRYSVIIKVFCVISLGYLAKISVRYFSFKSKNVLRNII